MNLLKESNTTLESTINDESPTTVEFIFNLKHLPIGEYYFVLRPVDITTVDLAQNGDETIYDTIDASSFTVRFDKGGNYNESLDASYNGVDYLESRMLEDQVIYEGGLIEIHNNNFDLFFEQIYSSGNTYVINPAPCLVMGQKTYPVDTHVTIDGPSKIGNRIDLVSLTTDGLLKVVSGLPFTGKAKKTDYPINTLGFKIAYITTYQNSDAYWTCPVCGTINDGNISKAWHHAYNMTSVLLNFDTFAKYNNITLLSGDDEKTLFLNTIISICNKNYSVAIALAERGSSIGTNTDFAYLKCIALFLSCKYNEAERALADWKNTLKEHNRVLDDRFYFLSARICRERKEPYISAIQYIIRHTPRYVTPILFLKQSMNADGLKLETEDKESHLVDIFNQSTNIQELLTAWKEANLEERKNLLLAILNYPYEQ